MSQGVWVLWSRGLRVSGSQGNLGSGSQGVLVLGSQGVLGCLGVSYVFHSYVYVTTTITLIHVHKWNCYELLGYEPVRE